MRVIFVLAGLGTGGAERVVSLISGCWAERGWQVSVAAFDAPGDPVAFRFDEDVELIRLNIGPGGGSLWRGILSSAKRWLALRKLFRSRRPDLVISFLTKVNVLSLLAALGSGIPVVISERNNPGGQAAHSLWAWSWRALSRLAAGTVLQTEAIKARYGQAMAARSVVIPNPVEIPPFNRQNHDGHVIAAAGRLENQKGFDRLIAGFATIADDFPDWRLVIWGEGQERTALERQVRDARLTDRISLPGNSSQPLSWLETADLFVLSSRFEGFPNVLVEAMSAGIPVIACDCDFGPAEIVSDGVDGLLVPPDDILSLAEAMRKAMSDDGLRSRLAAAAVTSAERFELTRIVQLWDSLVNKALYSA